jgi:hypothetical protein
MKHVLSDAKALADDLQQVAAGPCKTADGHGVQLMLNSGPFGELTSQQMSWIDGGGRVSDRVCIFVATPVPQ